VFAGVGIDKRWQYRPAHPQRGEERTVNFLLDLLWRVVLVGFCPDGAADVINQHIYASGLGQCEVHGGLRSGKGFQIGGGGVRLTRTSASELFCALMHQISAVYQDHGAIFTRDALSYSKANILGCTRDNNNLVFEALRGNNTLLIGGATYRHRHLYAHLFGDPLALFRVLLTSFCLLLSGTLLLFGIVLLIVDIQRWGVVAVEVLAYCLHHWWWATQVGIVFTTGEVLRRIHVIGDKATALMSFFLR